MDRQQIDDLTDEEIIQMKEEMDDLEEEKSWENFENQQDFMESYGAPEEEAKINAQSFLHKAAFDSKDTVRTTFLHEGELGRPLFTVRFMLDMEDVAKHYLDDLPLKLGYKVRVPNRISNYFNSKIQNITSSGMSNKGFAMNLNVTQKRDINRQKTRENPIENLKGGRKP